MTAEVVDINTARANRRAMPYNLDAEASIIGGVLIRNESLDDLTTVETDDFYLNQHKVVWDAVRNLQHARQPIDTVTLEHEIDKRGKLEAIGGVGFLGDLALRVPTPDNVVAYRDIVKRLSANRRAILALAESLDKAYNWPHDPVDLVLETAGRLQRIEEIAAPKRLRILDCGMALEELEDFRNAPVYSTPFETLNRNIGFGGFVGTQVYTLAAGTGRGKTTFVASCAGHVASTDEPTPVLVATYEMRPGYFVARRAAGLLGVHSNEILRGGDFRLSRVMNVMPNTRLFFLHKPSLVELRLGVDIISQRFGKPPLVIVDYLQKLTVEIAKRQQRVDMRLATSEASDTLCDIADRSKAAVLAVSAIGRQNNKKTANPRKVEPYDLVDVAKESGDVEYDGAGLIVLSLSKDIDGDERIATITLAKTRFGREVHIDARYHGARGEWRDLGEADIVIDPEPVTSTEVTRMRITDALRAGTVGSATQLARLVGGTRKLVLSEIKEMVGQKLILRTGRGLELPQPAIAQTVHPGLIAAASREIEAP
jgi:replicative DNA helicase